MTTQRRVQIWASLGFLVGVGCADADQGRFDTDASTDVAASDSIDATHKDAPTFDIADASPDHSDTDARIDSAMRVCADRELCDNGFDDDCSGMADDGCVCIPGSSQMCYLAAPDTAGVGPCTFGTQRCEGAQEFGRWTACEGASGPSGEVCGDNIDNDCNGRVDEGCDCRPGEMGPCYDGPAGTRGVGVCRDGQRLCFAGPGGVGAMWGACTGDTRPSTESCDDMLDNDCNGTVNDCCTCTVGTSRMCYGGPMGTAGVGRCRAGSQTCATGCGGGGSSTGWSDCTGQAIPQPERCDGIDDDCNGVVDDGCLCRLGETQSCYEGAMGTRMIGTCTDGMRTCVAGPDGVGTVWGMCTGQRLPTGETCDDADNNCNGAIDESCVCRRGQTQSCYAGPAGTAGVGPCRAGSSTCEVLAGVARWGTCTGQALPVAEVCGDRVDNNCNGMVDEGCVCVVGNMEGCYSGPAGTAGRGNCRAGTRTCVIVAGAPAWGACTGETLPQTERCDMVDNDCNGVLDDGCACTPGAVQGCYSGPTGTAGVGACRGGSQTCAAGAGGVGAAWGTCTAQVLPATEVCNMVDDNCDGRIDEGCACTVGAMRTCYGGAAGTAGVGVCRAGSQTCALVAGVVAWGDCTGDVVPSAELCTDMVDNNCNGMVNEGCLCTPGATQSCYTGPTATAGVGVCRAGSQTCAAGTGGVGSAWGVCTGQVLPTTETCNMTDDNCNMLVDDGISCAGPTAVCPAPRTVPAGTAVVLTASTTGGVSYRWEVISAPAGAAYTLGSPTAASTTFFSVIVGTFTLRFTVTDAAGRTATCTTTITNQGHGLRVELQWDVGVVPPTTAGRVDLDLHLHNRTATGWFDSADDCFFSNRTPRWDVRSSTADDPSLDIDNVYGFGPENIRVDSPVPATQTYSVGVNYYLGSPSTPANATVRIYCGNVLRGTYMHRMTGGTTFTAANDFWRVARVTFTDPSNCTIVLLDNVLTTAQAISMP
jgi:hypothetical protein